MGRWNRRFRHGGRTRNYNYVEPPISPPRKQPLPYGRSEDGVPSWEIDFCYLSGLTWDRIRMVKKFMCCDERVSKWNDLAGEEAFHDARRSYWRDINGLPCEGSSPDSEIYIDKVDWNSYIDPELMLDLDRECFGSDDGTKRSDDKLRKEASRNTNEGENPSDCNIVEGIGEPKLSVDPWEQQPADNKNTNKRENPWESNCVQGTGEGKSFVDPWKKDADDDKNTNKGENPWEINRVQGTGEVKSFIDPWEQSWTGTKSINKGKNPWEGNHVQGRGEVKSFVDPWDQCWTGNKSNKGDNFWGSNRVQGTEKLKSYVDSWEQCNVEVDQSMSNNVWRDSVGESSRWNGGQSQYMHNSHHVRGNQRMQSSGHIQMGGRGYVGSSSWQSNQRGNDLPGNATSNDRLRGDWGNNSERKKFSEFSNDDSRRFGYRTPERGGRERYDDCRRREGSMHHVPSGKRSRFTANDHETSYQWRN